VTASAVTGAATLFFVWDAARVVARPEPRTSVDDRRTERLARGAHAPEVVLLTAFALASSGVWVPAAFAGTPTALQSTLGFLGGFAAPAFAVPARLGLDLRDTLSLRVPAPRAWAALLLLVPGNLALAFVLTAALDPLLPVPNWLAREVARVAQDVHGPELVLAFTLVPGICEELLFRGAMLGLLRRSARPRAEIVAIVVQAAAFAIAHGWAARLPYTFALGLVFGALAVRTRSIVPGMVAHTLHNLLVVTIGGEVLMTWAHQPWAWAVAALSLVGVWAAGRGAVKG
jgi:sodium transport system permease protein